MIKISVIIPIYNCEEYLEQCIKSVFCQTLKELEIICVDDGSTDNSAQIMKELQMEDPRIVLFQQKNQGAGPARNLGLQKAHGKYVTFLDADDYYLDNNALEVMFHACDREKVLVCGSLRKYTTNDGEEEPTELFQETIKNKILFYKDFQLDYDYQSFLFSRNFLIENSFYFPSYRRFQDPPFLVKVLFAADKFVVADTYLYCYRSSDVNVRFNAEKIKDLLDGLIENLMFAQEHGLETLFQKTVFRLEYEYESVICKNIIADDLKVIKRLMKANGIINAYYKREEEYIIRPLRRLLLQMSQYEKKIIEQIKLEKEIMLYGAGRYGRAFLGFLEKNNMSGKVKGFLVSDLQKNEPRIDGIPVFQFSHWRGNEAVFVTVGEKIQLDIENYLKGNGYTAYIVVRDEFLRVIADE